jgi:putative thioredoxin
LKNDPGNLEAQAGLARAAIARRDLKKARQILDAVAKEGFSHAEIAAARSALELAEEGQKAMAGSNRLKARLAQDADDHEARFELATALFGSGERDAAIEELLTLFKRDRAWNEEAARKQLLKFFEAMGPTDPLTQKARRRLSSLMFA